MPLRQHSPRPSAQKDNELHSLFGLGDRTLSGLLWCIRSLNANHETLLHALFLAQLPIKLHQVLDGSANTDVDEMSATAAHIMEVSWTTSSFPGVSGLKKAKRLVMGQSMTMPLSFYHAKFGKAASKCYNKGIPLSHLIPSPTA